MKIEEALPLLREGKKIARRMWLSEPRPIFPRYMALHDAICAFLDSVHYIQIPFSHSDLFAEDWEEVQ